MIKLDLHDSNYFAVCKHYKQIYDTPRIKSNLQLMREALKNIVIYLLLSPYGNDQQDLLHRLSEDKNLQEIPKYKYSRLTVKKQGKMSS
jgi:26S proteasome regulatory subunit N5